MSAITPLQLFLLRKRVDKGSEFTHTSLAKPPGSFYISGDDEDTFMSLYTDAIEEGEEVHLTEKHKDICPLLIDLDLRFPLQNGLKRMFSMNDIQDFISIYMKAVKTYLLLPTRVDIYVMIKEHPVRTQNLVKDGLHIMIPSLVSSHAVQRLCRMDCLSKINPWLSKIKATNDAKDAYDESVLGRNNWMMYGSCKPNNDPYSVDAILRYHVPEDSFEFVNCTTAARDLPILLSIRNKFEETAVNPQKVPAIEAYEQELSYSNRHNKSHPCITSAINNTTNTVNNIEIVKLLVDTLNPNRSISYDDWMRVGWCLRNIDHRLCNKWVEFSRKSAKYIEGECEDRWSHMTSNGGLGMGTLCMWAREDNPERYREITRQDLRKLVMGSKSGTHCDVARVVKHLFGHRFVCASLTSKIWYEFRDHRWHRSDGGCSLRKIISSDVWREYKEMGGEYNRMSVATDEEDDQSRYSEYEKKMLIVAEKLKITNYKDNLMKECAEQFYEEKFEEKLDSNCNLIGFDNGIFDLAKDEFRTGRPDDYITFTTGIDYVEYDREHPCVEEINTFMSQVQPKAHIQKYCLVLFASFLSGEIHEERFHIWTGSGGNGKSRLIELFESCFGDYSCKFPVTMLTQKRVASNAANSELARAKGKRMAVMQEPSEDEKLNIGLMKELSGGDKIMARSLYTMPIEFKPQFHMLLMCNHLPHVDSSDGGTWRRVRVVEFNSRFVQDPNPNDINEFPIDLELSKKFDRWRPHFIGMLLDYFRLYQVEGLHEPDEVMACTKEYQRKNDFVADFLAETVKMVPNERDAFIRVDDLYEEFKDWAKSENISMKIPRRKDIQVHLEKKFGKVVRQDGNLVFTNVRLKKSSDGCGSSKY